MPGDSNTKVWYILAPQAWPAPPLLMSFSVLMELETCPRRWALSAADYPDIWPRSGYPQLPQQSAIAGTVIHTTLEKITNAMSERSCTSVEHEDAIFTLRELGGYSALIERSIDYAIQFFEGNPRAAPVLERMRLHMISQIPEFRIKVQSLLSRVNLESRTPHSSKCNDRSEEQTRETLQYGSHAEVRLKANDLGWCGIADLITISPTYCEIRDFKTGKSSKEHEFQLHIYALLWYHDQERNPNKRPTDRLVVAYTSGDIEVPVPEEEELTAIETDLRNRTKAAIRATESSPPVAIPIIENCCYCGVRHLCEEYWSWIQQPEAAKRLPEKNFFGDLQVRLTAHHGPASWDGTVVSGLALKIGQRVLMRITNVDCDFQPDQQIRVLNAYIDADISDTEDDKAAQLIVTAGTSSEIFILER